MPEITRVKRPRKPLSEEGKPGRYDHRNKLNDLTGKEWLLLTKSFWVTESCVHDKRAYGHPAPFMIPDVSKLISLFTKKGMTVLDPFAGSGSALIAANMLGRHAIGIDINPQYKRLASARLRELNFSDYSYLVGDARECIADIASIDYAVTSPPYHNILKNNGNGLRHNSGKAYRIAARDGVEYYTDDPRDLGNCEHYSDFINGFQAVMTQLYLKLIPGRYATIIIGDFTVNKREQCVQADMVQLMQRIGFEFAGTTVLLQPVKPLFPFGYPYAYKINHDHQNIMTFRRNSQGCMV